MSPLLALPAGLLAGLTGGLLTVPVRVVTHRTLVSEETTRIPEEYIFHRLGMATVLSVVANWVVALAIVVIALIGLAVGFVCLSLVVGTHLFTATPSLTDGAIIAGVAVLSLLPSAVVGVGLVFTGQEIAVRDKGVLDAIRGSWALTAGARGRLFLLAAVPVVVQIPLSFALFTALPRLPANVLTTIESTAISFLLIAIMARAYKQRIHATGASFRTGPLSE
ncbi:hypothetical protein ACFQL1_07060 [Halomicroarcula sp. GCM10025709]|uniref:hypothetical protein n=1 Tax=Haloarcula TaxID=2237 RepID=UPI0024C3D9E4|nr:hypothetical protein [Halomicroarcula sp. YJ-61-S]